MSLPWAKSENLERLFSSHFTSVLQAISYAGGFTLFASRNNVHVLRNVKNGQGETKQVMIPVPYQDIVQGKNLDANIILKAGDVIVVP